MNYFQDSNSILDELLLDPSDMSRQLENDLENEEQAEDNSPIPYITWRAASMAMVASVGGLIFGYDTGQCPPSIWSKPDY